MGGIVFTPNFDAGHVFDAAIYILLFIGLIYTLRGDVKGLKTSVAGMQIEIQKIAAVMVEMARQDERLKHLDQRIDDLVTQQGRPNARKERAVV